MTTLDTTTPTTQAVERKLHARVVRAAQLRAAIRDCSQLLAEAERILEAVPDGCDILLAWSDEGSAVAAAASALAADRGRRLNFERASHLVPLSPAPAETWSFVSVEQLLGLGDVRPWARRWADDRGGRLLLTRARSELDLVA